jgi:hypothetical protein
MLKLWQSIGDRRGRMRVYRKRNTHFNVSHHQVLSTSVHEVLARSVAEELHWLAPLGLRAADIDCSGVSVARSLGVAIWVGFLGGPSNEFRGF